MMNELTELVSGRTLYYVIGIATLVVGLLVLFNSNDYHFLGIFLSVFGFTLTGFTVRKDYLEIRNEVKKGKEKQ